MSAVELLHGLDDGPALLVFISPSRFALMTPAAACELRDQLQAALEQCGELPRILQRQAS